MVKTIGSIIMILGGIALIILSAHDNIKNASVPGQNKRRKYKMLTDSLTGFCFTILGITALLNIFTDNTVVLLSATVLLVDKIADIIISKKASDDNPALNEKVGTDN